MPAARRRATLLLGLLCIASPMPARAQGRLYSPIEAAAVGRAVLDAQVARYGRVRNANWDQDIAFILTKLERATGYPASRVGYVVVGNDDVNAAAIPGGSLIVNAGLMRFLHTLASEAGRTPQQQRNQFRAFLAAVLSHEIAHITLGHTDSLMARILSLATESGAPDGALGDPLTYRAAVQDSGVTLEMLQHSRERELAADRVGALYLLRGGWTIQAAMDLMRAVDLRERRDPSFFESISYVRSHPRASTREAALEGFRAQLKFLQGDYDDALALIQNNIAVPAAVTLLDTVLAYFPDMLPALHARGTAYHQLWLETVPVPTQQVRASLTTYALRFLPTIRGIPGDLSLYAAAKKDYTSVLAREPLARTVAQQALLDAYAGDCPVADQRARQAALSDSLSVDVVNNRGVVLFVCAKPVEALAAFQRAQRLSGLAVVPSFLFNTARAMKAVRDSRADSYFRRYLTIDSASAWADEARGQLGISDPSDVKVPKATINAPPSIQGIALGYSLERVYAAWGSPTSVTGDTVAGLKYQARGVSVAISPSRGVVLILLLTREAGAVDGIRVGDPIAAARATWGTLAERRDDYIMFDRGTWIMAVGARGASISMLAIVANP
jgi:predicted Zn-dependent protease